ncbi:TPA: DUF1320 domain-containing protein [Escherichia coli]|nr:DUF1320 domain-containing protein [Escherichia coli]
MVDITRVRRESLRWSLLVALNKTRPYTASETLLLDVSRAIYRLYARRPEGDLPDTVKDDHKEALRQLRELRDNRLTLGLPSTQKDVPEPGEFRVRSRPATFGGRDGLLEKY